VISTPTTSTETLLEFTTTNYGGYISDAADCDPQATATVKLF